MVVIINNNNYNNYNNFNDFKLNNSYDGTRSKLETKINKIIINRPEIS
jgi:hypothetical protein